MLQYQTAGESHGPCLIATVTGLPYGTPVDLDFVQQELDRRRRGYGRSVRMTKEQDRVEILSGVRHGRTIGSPLTLRIDNLVRDAEERGPLHRPRPGHADLAGSFKFDDPDARNVSERASARETAARVAAGALASSMLRHFGIDVVGYLIEMGGIATNVRFEDPSTLRATRNSSDFSSPDSVLDEKLRIRVDEARAAGDTLGGIFEVTAFGVPAGLGSHAQWTDKMDARLARALMSIQSVKAVEVGMGLESARRTGSTFQDEIVRSEGEITRTSNRAGGIEGGISNGQPVIVRAACKPISTLMKPLRTVDLNTGEEARAVIERSDIAIVPAASVIGEAVTAFEIAALFLDRFGADTWGETERRFQHRARIAADGVKA